MSGRLTQLGRQLRKLRTIVGGAPSADPVTTLRRATQLAGDLACEHADAADAEAGFRELGRRGVLDPALAERLVTWTLRDDALAGRGMEIGGDLDQFLRSLEHGGPAGELPFAPLLPQDSGPAPESTAAVTVSGRLLELEVRDGRATVSVEKHLIAMANAAGDPMISFALAAAPTSKPDVHHERTGAVRVVWQPEKVTLELSPDFSRVQI